MSKYIRVLRRGEIRRMALVEAGGRSMDQVRDACGCDCILNSWFYDTITGRPVGNLCIDGTVKAGAGWAGYGLTWDTGGDVRMELVPGARAGRNYLSGVELLTPSRGPGQPLNYAKEYGAARGRSAVLLAGERVILYCSGDGTADAKTPEALRNELVELGCRYDQAANLRALGLDSGGSAQCNFDGQAIHSGRRVAGYLCVWTNDQGGQEPPENTKEDTMSSYTVCLDPGHGPGNVNASPDGTYREAEFCWDLCTRILPLLEAGGVRTVCTRTENTVPDLTERAAVSNRVGADCFVSIHSNAAGNDGWYDASGLEIYTSQGPMDAPRNQLATQLVNAFHAAGVSLRSQPVKHAQYTVLVKTDAPACLIEYGFHTSREDVARLKDDAYRDTLAQATAAGILAWLGVAGTQQAPADDAPADWAAQGWKKAADKGVLDGTRPLDGVTRQELAVVLDRLGLLE